MGIVFVALLMAIGTSVWTFTKLQHSAGYGNDKNEYIVSGIVFFIVFLVVFTIGKSFIH